MSARREPRCAPRDIAARLPLAPGVYRFSDAAGDVLYLFPVIGLAAGHSLQRRLEQIGPMSAGIDSLATQPGLPLSAWPGLGVVALWAAGALTLAAYVLRTRDA